MEFKPNYSCALRSFYSEPFRMDGPDGFNSIVLKLPTDVAYPITLQSIPHYIPAHRLVQHSPSQIPYLPSTNLTMTKSHSTTFNRPQNKTAYSDEV